MGAHAKDAADAGTVLTPSSEWHLDYAEEKCRLARTFGEGENRHILYIDQAAPSERFDLTAAGPAFKNFPASGAIDLQFGEAINQRNYRAKKGNFKSFGPALIYSRITMSAEAEGNVDANDIPFQLLDAEGAKTIDFIAFGRGKRKVTFATGELFPVLSAINTCTLDLIRSWGVDPDKHRTMTRSATWKNPTVVASRVQASYPAAALSRGERAIFNLRIIIDEAGAVIECKLSNATKASHLESPACKAFSKAKFEPALDADGQPMRSYYTTAIIYDIN